MIDRDCVDILCPVRPRDVLFAALYDGPGTGRSGGTRITAILDRAPDMAVRHLGPKDLRTAVLSQFDAVVFPGGSGSKQARAIGTDGREAVRRFVRESGGYVGICAGAYLCSAHYRWSLGLIDTKVLTGAVEIAGVGKKQMWYRGPKATVTIELTARGQELFSGDFKQTKIDYQNGPIISPENAADLPRYTVLAWFRTENTLYPPQEGTMRDTPAIVCAPFGMGRVISISPHPESSKGLESMITTSASWTAGKRTRPKLGSRR